MLILGCAPTTQTGYFSPLIDGRTKDQVCNYYKTTTENQLCFKGTNREQAYFPESKIEILSSEVIRAGKIDWEYKIGKSKYIIDQYFVFENVNKPMDCSNQMFVQNCNYGDGTLKLVTENREEAYRYSDPKKLAEFEKKEKIRIAKEDADSAKVHLLYVAGLEKKYGSECKAYKEKSSSTYEQCLENADAKATISQREKEQQKKIMSELDNSNIGQMCRTFGYKQGTEKYADCMKDLYIQQQKANNTGTTNVIVKDSGNQALADELKRQRQQEGFNEVIRYSQELLQGKSLSEIGGAPSRRPNTTSCYLNNSYQSGMNRICVYQCPTGAQTTNTGAASQCPPTM